MAAIPSRAGRRHAAIDDDEALFRRGELERQTAGVGLKARLERRRAAGIHDQHAAAGLEALISGIAARSTAARRALVIGEQASAKARAGVTPMPLKCANVPSEWRKNRSIGIMRSMALSSACGGAMLREANAWRSGSSSSKSSMIAPGSRLTWPPSGRICRSISRFSRVGGGFDVARLSGDAERGVVERDRGLHAGGAAIGMRRGAAQITHLTDQAAQKAPIEPHIGVLQHQRRLAEPGDDPPRQHVRTPGHGCQEPCSVIHSSTSARALARVMPDLAARRWRSQEKPSSAVAHSSDGGAIWNIERLSQTTTLPAKAKRPE